MLSLYALKNSDDVRTLDGLKMDALALETMKALDLKCFRSTKDRALDRQKAIGKYAEKVDLSLYAIHHTYRGLVALVPREIHSQVAHNGYFYRLAH